jgi:transposase-like protein
MKVHTGYRIVGRDDVAKVSAGDLATALALDGQALLPILELITTARGTVDEAIDVMGRATIQAVLELSAAQVAGEPHQGKKAGGGGVIRHGHQGGVVRLSDRSLRVTKPRLRRKGENGSPSHEVEVPAYVAMRGHPKAGATMMDILLKGISTRNYKGVIREMAQTASVSKSAVSREFVEASDKTLEALLARRFDTVTILAVYIDGIILGKHHILTALGVDEHGTKHVLGMREGASENAAVVKALLEDLVERGLKPDPARRRLFIIDGSKALRAGIDAVYGTDQPVQRCRIHKIRNVQGHLPEGKARYATLVLRAAFKMEDHVKAIGKLRELARELEDEWPGAAGSLREGLEEMFTVNRLGLSASLRRCLGTTNIIESPQSTVRRLTHKVDHWQDGSMALRWAATSFTEAQKTMRKISGHKDLYQLKASLEESVHDRVAESRKAG